MGSMEYYNDFRIDYNTQDKAVAIEFFPSSELFIKSDDFTKLKATDLFKISFKWLNKILSTLDSSNKDNGCGIISLKYGIGTYLEDSEGDICESIIIFKEGYYAPLGW